MGLSQVQFSLSGQLPCEHQPKLYSATASDPDSCCLDNGQVELGKLSAQTGVSLRKSRAKCSNYDGSNCQANTCVNCPRAFPRGFPNTSAVVTEGRPAQC
jgi:hypothetical protein